MDPILITILVGVVALVVGAVVAGVVAYHMGQNHRKRVAEAKLGSAEAEAERIRSQAKSDAERARKEAVLNAKDEIQRLRSEADNEIKERRKEVQRQESRLQQKEETLDRKIENNEKKEENLAAKEKAVEARMGEIDELKKQHLATLERISGFTVDQAKEYLLQNLQEELTHEKALKLQEFTEQLKDEADSKARMMIAQAIQRVAADQVTESTVSVVALQPPA